MAETDDGGGIAALRKAWQVSRLSLDRTMQITLSQAAQRLLDALAAAMPYAPHRAEFDIVADAADDLRAALKREEEALAWLEERKKHWRRELERMRAAPECPHGSDEACKLCYLEQQATPQQDPELSAALGYPGGISDPVLNRVELLRMVAEMRLAQPKEPQ